jgi:hypothetical protein
MASYWKASQLLMKRTIQVQDSKVRFLDNAIFWEFRN